jgi:L-rhamnose isomerase / sugar isomerase
MKITTDHIQTSNKPKEIAHAREFNFLAENLEKKGLNVEQLIQKLQALQIAIPSWALGTGGTRFGRFSGGGEPATLIQKIQDIGILHALNRSSGSVSLHIPWDIPQDYDAVQQTAAEVEIGFDAVNSNTFQDQTDQSLSYKFGSLANSDKAIQGIGDFPQQRSNTDRRKTGFQSPDGLVGGWVILSRPKQFPKNSSKHL